MKFRTLLLSHFFSGINLLNEKEDLKIVSNLEEYRPESPPEIKEKLNIDIKEALTYFDVPASSYSFDIEPFRPAYLESRKRKPAKTRKKCLKYSFLKGKRKKMQKKRK